jgi:hypothetical protein
MCLGGGGTVPIAPNTSAEQSAAGNIGAAGAAAGASQLGWAQGQAANNGAVASGLQGSLTPQVGTDTGANAAGAGMYGQTLGGLGNQLTTAQNYGNAGGMNTAQAGAAAATGQAYSAARTNNMQQLGSYGVDPSQMKSGALNLNANLQQAGAVGNAGYQAGQQRQLTGMGLVSNALSQNMMGSQVGQGYGAGANATGQTVAGIGNQTTSTSSGALSAPSQMMNTGLTGYGTEANIANQTFGNQMTAYGANQANANALMNMAGQGLGMVVGAADGGAIRGRYANGGSAGMVPLPAGGPAIGPSYQAPSSSGSGSGGGGGGGGQSNPMSAAMLGYRQGQNIGGNIANAQDNSMLPQTMANVNQDPEIQNLMSSVGSQNGAADSAMGAGDTVAPAAGAAAGDAAAAAAPAAGAAAGDVAAAAGTGAAADAAGTALAAAAPEIAAVAAEAAPALLAAANGGAIPQRKRPDFGNPAVQRSQGVPPQIGIPQPMSVAADGGQPRVPPTMNMPGPWIAANGGSPGPGMIQHGMSDGTGIDDQVHAKVSVGEYIIPADVVHAKGKEFFDKLLQRYHVPAQQQRQQMMGGQNGHFQR